MNESQQKQLNKTEIEILDFVCRGQSRDQKKNQVQICEALGKDKSQISRKLKELGEHNIIERSSDGRCKKVSITDKGCKFLLFSRSNTSEKRNNLLHLHKFGVKFPIKNIDELKNQRDEDWREELSRNSSDFDKHNEENDAYILDRETYTYWITRKHVVVFLKDLLGHDPILLKDKAIRKAIKIAGEIEEEIPANITDEYSEIRAVVSNQHMAIIGDPLSTLVHETDHQNPNIKISDETGKIRLWLDNSENRKDLEAGTQFGTHGFTEEDIENILKFYRKILDDPQSLLK
jgi:DNA-binding MarR family transcriptional regulator